MQHQHNNGKLHVPDNHDDPPVQNERDRETLPPEPPDTQRPEPTEAELARVEMALVMRAQDETNRTLQRLLTHSLDAESRRSAADAKNWTLLRGSLDSMQSQIHAINAQLGVGHQRMIDLETSDKMQSGEIATLRDDVTAVGAELHSMLPAPIAAVAGTKVLIVEDQDSVRRGFTKLLRRYGFLVAEAKNSIEALDALVDKPHVAIVDVALGTSDGLALIRRCRREYPDVQCVIVSGRLTEAQRTEAKTMNVRCFTKPPDWVELVKTVNELRGPELAL